MKKHEKYDNLVQAIKVCFDENHTFFAYSRFRKLAAEIILRYHAPYVFQRIDSSSKYIALNREYKPLGLIDGYFDYSAYFDFHIDKEDLCFQESTNNNSERDEQYLWLYDDLSAPWISKRHYKNYAQRLLRAFPLLKVKFGQYVGGMDINF